MSTTTTEQQLIEPHGGKLIDRTGSPPTASKGSSRSS